MASTGIVLGLNVSVGLSNLASVRGSDTVCDGSLRNLCMASTRSAPRALRLTTTSPSKSFFGNLVFDPLKKPSRGSTPVKALSSNAGADASGKDDSEKSIAPLVPESPVGQFLVSILRSHPHLFAAAADQQLERLAADRDAAVLEEQQSSSGTDLTLYKRIKELKAEERRKAIEEVMYALIVQKFVEGKISLVPKLPAVSDSGAKQVEVPPAQDKELEGVHSLEALEMVREHLAVVLGGRGSSTFLDQQPIAQISKLRIGQVYAASIMYGYFLRRVDQRFQLEKHMKGLLGSGQTVDTEPEFQISEDDKPIESGKDNLAAEAAAAIASLKSQAGKGTMNTSNISNGFAPGVKPSKLRSYVMSFDPETLQSCATMRAKESLNVIEKHAEALFGKPEIQVAPDGSFKVVNDDSVKVSFSGLRRMVLEAVAFGSFLWDVETTVDSQYNLIRQ